MPVEVVKIHGGGTAFALPPLVHAIFYREICHRCLLTMEQPPLPTLMLPSFVIFVQMPPCEGEHFLIKFH